MDVQIGVVRDNRPAPGGTSIDDADEDGFTIDDGDCDDQDDTIKPHASELCDGIDNDCDGVIDQLAGTKVNPCERFDSFLQKTETDVLLVWDPSTEMSAYKTEMAEGSYAMARHLLGPASFTQIGVITTDLHTADGNGLLRVPDQFDGKWLSGNAEMEQESVREWFELVFTDEIQQLMWGDEGVRTAISMALDRADSENRGFFRAQASLNVIVVTDESDESVSPGMAEFFQRLRDVKPEGTRFFAITQTTNAGCAGGGAHVAENVISLVQQSGGYYESVCMTDWRGFMSSVGQAIASDALTSTFRLSAPAMLESVSIEILDVDGTSYPWDAGFALSDAQSLVFFGTRPPAGSTIKVYYEVDPRLLEP